MTDEQFYKALEIIDDFGMRGVDFDQHIDRLGDSTMTLSIGNPPLRQLRDDQSAKAMLKRVITTVNDLADAFREIRIY